MSAEDRNGQVSTDEECTDCSTRERSFDQLTKGLASANVTRRGALRLLATTLLGGALASVPGVGRIAGESGEAQAADCANAGQSCTAQKCCHGFTCLVDQTSGTEKFCCPNTQVCGKGGRQSCCPTGGACVNDQCVCINNTTRCFDATNPFDLGTCRNLQNDNNNCGKCALACNTAAGEACCSGVCKNLLEDEQNCGACGHSCGANETCIAGVCCPNVRVCGNTCLATACSATKCEICDPAQGKCVSTCTSGQTCCNGVCCDNATTTCIGGVCCPKAKVCGTTCLVTACDTTKCEICDPTSGKCVSACTSGQTCCNGSCVNLQTDAANCGACGTTCTGGKTCQAGVCACPTGTKACSDGICRQCCANSDCTGGKTCQAGVCACPTGTTECLTGPNAGSCQKTDNTCSGNGGCCSNQCCGRVAASRVCCAVGSVCCSTGSGSSRVEFCCASGKCPSSGTTCLV